VRLRGALGEQFGEEWHLALDQGTVSEAFHAIAKQQPGFRLWVSEASKEGIGLRILVGGKEISTRRDELLNSFLGVDLAEGEEERKRANETLRRSLSQVRRDLQSPCGRDEIEFVPEPAASGWFGDLIGQMLNWFVNETVEYFIQREWPEYTTLQGWLGQYQELPKPVAPTIIQQAQDLSQAEQADERGSYAFSGAVNKRGISAPLPLLFGRGIVGSHVGSFGIRAERNRKKKT
jgi:predicted phage tail protein